MRTIVAAAAMLCLASPALAQEDCDPAELRGAWRYFTFSDVFEPPDFNLNLPSVDGCTAVMSSRGTFRSESRCLNSDLRATLDIRSNCTIRGRITQRFDDGGFSECGISAAVTRDRELISGIGICVDDLDFVDVLMFNMVRR
jgi:hypothetical protein